MSSIPRRASSASQASSGGHAPGARANAGQQRVSLGQGAGVGGARRHPRRPDARRRAGRDGRGAPTGAPLTSSSRSGMKTLTSGRDSRPGGASRSAPSRRRCFGSPGSKPTSSRCSPSSTREVERHPRDRRAAANQLALVGGARRARGAAEVDRLEEIGLAGPVGPADHGQAGRQRDLGTLVVAEVAQLDARHAHDAPLHVQADRHDEVPEPGALVPGLDQARDAAG